MSKPKQFSRIVICLLVLSQCGFVSAIPAAFAATNIGTNITTGGNLTVDGALKFTSGAAGNYILNTDASGNATWIPVGSALSHATADDLPGGATNTYYNAADVNSRADARINLQKGAVNGLATLDAGGQIPGAQIPALAINQTYVVANIAARNALTPNTGDVAIVTDTGSGESRSYIWDSSIWIELLTPLQLYLARSNNLSDLANPAVARTNLSLGTGDSPTFTGLTLSGLTPGSLLFGGAGGAASQDNANLFWDNVTKRLGIGTNTPSYALDVNGDIKAGDGSLIYLGAKADPDPAGTNGTMYYNTTNNKFRCYEGGSWKDCLTTAGNMPLNETYPAVAANSINNGDNKQTWNWSLTTADNVGFNVGENLASTAGGDPRLVNISTLAGSTAQPLHIENFGNNNSIRVDDEPGDATPFVVTATGQVGVGTATFNVFNTEKLKVEAEPGSQRITGFYGDLNAPLYTSVQNRNSGASATSAAAEVADDGSTSSNYISSGITSSAFADPAFTIAGPHDGYLFNIADFTGTHGGNMLIGTAEPGMSVKFFTGGGASAANEQMRIDGSGNVGIGTTTAGSKLDVKGTLRLSGATSGYVGLAPAAVAGSTTYILPAADGTSGQALSTDGAGNLAWINPTGVWQRIGTVLSPTTAGDDVTTSGAISTSGTGTITSAGLLTGSAGAAISGATTNINDTSNFDTNINTGTSTGAVSIGNSAAGAINVTSGAGLSLTGGAVSSMNTTAGDINLQPAGTGTTGTVQIGAGGAGSATPDLLALDVKNTAGDPAGFNGALYYNANTNKYRCYKGGTWANCSSAQLDTILAATAANSINNGDNAQTWNWSLTTPDNKGFTFGENVASTATGDPAVLKASTLTSSTAMPLFVENLGDNNSFRVDDSSGDLTPFLIDKDGNVAIGSNSFDPVNPERLKVDSGSTPSYNIITATGNLDNYLQMNIKNRNSGGNASSDLVATADNGTENVNYIDLGINSSGYSNPAYSIGGPDDSYLVAQGVDSLTPGGNLTIGTAVADKVIKFHTGGTDISNERMRIDGDGLVGINTTSPGSELDVKGTLRLSGATSGYVGLAPAAVAGSTTYTLPAADGASNQVLSTNGSGILSWINQSGVWQRVGTVLSPLTAGDDVTTSGAISTTGTGTITSAGLLTGNAGATISGAATSINDNSNFDTKINTGTSTGAVTVGNSAAGAINVTSGAALGLTGGAASSLNTTAGDITIQPAGTGTTAYLQVGAGGAGSATPDLLALDLKSTAGDPATGKDGAMYYNDNTNKFRCYTNGSWGDCDTTGGTATLQSTYNAGATITTSGPTDIAFTLTSGNFTASGAGAVNLTPTAASSFTSGGALTLTGGGASTWSTSSGALTLTSAADTTWGTTSGDLTLQANGAASGEVHIGANHAPSATPDTFSVDRKSLASGTGDPAGGDNGDMYYNDALDTFRCYEAGGWKDCGSTAASATTLQQAYTAGNAISTSGSNIAFTLNTTDQFTASGAGSVNLTPTGASSFTSGGALTLTGGASSTWGTSAGNLSLQAAGSGTTANVQVGIGGAGSTTPDLLALDVKSNAGDPAGFAGAMYYNANGNKFRCYENVAWKDCDAGVVASLQTAYYNGGSIITNGNPIAYTLTNGDFTAAGAGSVNLTPTGASSFTSAGALTLTGGAASTWGTSAGDLTLQAAGTGTGSVKIGTGGAGSTTPDLLALDVKSDAGDPAGFNGAIYYNGNSNKLRCFVNGGWIDCSMRSIGTAKGDLIAYTASNSPTRLPVGSNGQLLVSDSTQATGLRWANLAIANNSIDFAQLSDAMTVDANTSINLAGKNLTIDDLTGGGVLSMSTNAAALTLTAGAASSWTTTAGALTIDAGTTTPAALNLGTTGANAITIGKAGLTTTSIGPVQTGNAANAGSLKIADGSTNFITLTSPAIASDYTLTLPTTAGSSGQALTTNGTGTLSWSTLFTDPMTTRGDIIYRDATNTTTRLGRGTAGQVLKSNGTDIAYATLTGTDVGLGNVTNDAQVKQSIGTAKGDLIGYSASNTPVRVGVAALDGQVLTADSTQVAGIKWASLSVPADSLDFTEFKDAMAVDANTSINLAGKNLTTNDLTGGGVLSMSTNAAALTLTAGAASTWSTSAGALTIDSADGLNIGTVNSSSISLGRSGGGAINLTSPSGVNLNPYGAVAGNTTDQRFLELAANGANYVAFKAPDSLAVNNVYVLPTAYPGVSGYSLTSDTSGNLSWANIGGVLPGWTDNGTTVNLTTSTDKVFIGSSGAATAKLEITSSDANALRINPYGAAAGNTGALQFMELAANGTNYVGFKAPDNIAANVGWVLPSADGTNGQVLTTDGAGVLSWQATPAAAVSSVFGRTGAVTAVSTDYTTLTALTNLSSAAGVALNIDSGTTGALNIGTGASSKTITIGNTTGTTGLVLASGTDGIKIGSTGTAITRHLSAASTIDIANVPSNSCIDSTVTVTGANAGDTAIATPTPIAVNGIEDLTLTWNTYVSSANTVVIRACNPVNGASNPDPQTWRVDVWQH